MSAPMRIAVVGLGIAGKVVAFYLRRAGHDVDGFEKEKEPGGSCRKNDKDTMAINGQTVEYTSGATVFGMMPDFIFQETGLAERVRLYEPQHPKIIDYGDGEQVLFHRDNELLKEELRRKWNETGDIDGWIRDEAAVAKYLRREFRFGLTPSLKRAERNLGREMVERWFLGTARNLLNRYFTSNLTKIFMALPVTESGPVSIDSPRSAFTLGLMMTGSVFGLGRWGFVEGRLWSITQALKTILIEQGVHIHTNVRVRHINLATGEVEASGNGCTFYQFYNHIVLAVDPLTAAKLIDDERLQLIVLDKKALGSAGKVIVLFKRPIRWKNPTGLPDFDTAFRFLIQAKSLNNFEQLSQAIRTNWYDYLPSSIQVYCDGAAMRKFGRQETCESVTLFIKDMGLTILGAQMPPDVLQRILTEFCARVENPEDIVMTKLLGPMDIKQTYGFHGGNYDGIELCDGQQYEQRTFSDDPARRFYMFGGHERLSFCSAAAWPYGSIAGTGGYLCAKEIIRTFGKLS